MKRHNADSIAGVVLLLGCGTALTVLSRRWGVGSSVMSQLAACAGPIAVTLGFGMAIHGAAMPLNRITNVTRIWGIAGSVAAAVNLWLVGYFERGGPVGRSLRWLMPLALIGAWLLPARFYGDTDLHGAPSEDKQH